MHHLETLTPLVITNNGTVGIGTTTPGSDYKLYVNGDTRFLRSNINMGGNKIISGGNSTTDFIIQAGGNNSNEGLQLNTIYNSTTQNIGILYQGILIKTNNNPRMFINSNGNIGINTESPATLLDVNGSAKINKVGIGTDDPKSILHVKGSFNGSGGQGVHMGTSNHAGV